MNFKKGLVVLLALSSFILFFCYLNSLFFSFFKYDSLNTTEKKTIFYSEVAFYYSFYDQIVKKSYSESWNYLLKNNSLEYPKTINALSKYNISFEVGIGNFYKLLNYFINIDPMLFYISVVIFINSLIVPIIFLSVYSKSKSYFISIISVLIYVGSYPFSTRVIGGISLRENISIPLFLLQTIWVFKYIDKGKQKDLLGVFIFTILHVLTWQFSQYTLFVQSIGLSLMYLFSRKTEILNIFKIYLGVVFLVFLLMFKNLWLINSFWFIYTILFLTTNNIKIFKKRVFDIIANISIFFGGMFILKSVLIKILNNNGNDFHVLDFLKMMFFGGQSNFHLNLYYCSGVIGFISKNIIEELFGSLLIPFIFFALLIFGCVFILNLKNKKVNIIDLGLIFILISYTLMAVFAVRFIFLAIPFWCIFMGYFFNQKKYQIMWNWSNGWKIFNTVALLIVLMNFFTFRFQKLNDQYNSIYFVKVGKDNPDMVNLLDWISNNTPKDAVFSGLIPTTALVNLATERRITINPFYEGIENRQRTFEIYQFFGRNNELTVYDYLRKNGTEYFISDNNFCFSGNGKCGVDDLFQYKREDYFLPNFCKVIQNKSKNFELVYANYLYRVYKILN